MTNLRLNSNVCINEDASDLTAVVALRQKLNEKCGFDERVSEIGARLETELRLLRETFEKAMTEKSNEISKKSQQIVDLKAQATIEKYQITSQQQTIEELKTEKVEMKMKLTAAKSELKEEKLQCKHQLSMVRELQDRLESQWNATCIAKTLQLRNNLGLKVQEIAELAKIIQQKETEIIEKTQENQNLNKKSELCY